MSSTSTPAPVPPKAHRAVVVIVITIALGVGAGVACMWRPDALAAMTLIPAWCWPLAGLIATIPVWRTPSRRIAVTLVGLWISFAAVWVEDFSSLIRVLFVSDKSSAIADSSHLRIVTLNCDSNARCLIDLQRENPDIVLLQESPGANALAKLASELYGEAGTFLAGGDTAILARGAIREPFVDRSLHFVAATVVFPDGRECRCVSLRLAPPLSRLDFWNGGFWSDHRDLRAFHRRQLRQIMTHVQELSPASTLLIGGDFNAVGLDRSLDELRPELTDAFAHCGTGWAATGTNEWPLFRVDQIWMNARLAPTRVSARKTASSDHRLVICDAVLPPPGSRD